jgi:hypothetical protein
MGCYYFLCDRSVTCKINGQLDGDNSVVRMQPFSKINGAGQI